MRVVHINDCASVGETILRYLPEELVKQHIKRSRGLWSKTFGIAGKILKAKGDIYHVHYLLQDCFLASSFGKNPLVGHAHGSDIRSGLKHRLWKGLVKHNLKSCDRIFVSTADLIKTARDLRPDVEYIPNPVDTDFFYPKPHALINGKKKVLVGSRSDWKVKHTDRVIRALIKVKDKVDVSIIQYGEDFFETYTLAKSLGLKLKVLPKASRNKLREYYWDADIVVGTFGSGGLGMVSLEAISCGRPVIAYVSSRFPEYEDWPLKDVDTEQKIATAIKDMPSDLWRKEYKYLEKQHNPRVIANRLMDIYEELLP